jgi:hypothetical protein
MGLNYKDRETDFKDILDVNSKIFYEHYKKTRKEPTEAVCRQYKWGTCLNTLFKSIAQLMVEKDGGVIVNNLGYFCYIMIPKKTRRGTPIKAKFDYRPYFFGSGHFKWWTFDRRFTFFIKDPRRFGNKKKRELNFTIFNKLKIRL